MANLSKKEAKKLAELLVKAGVKNQPKGKPKKTAEKTLKEFKAFMKDKGINVLKESKNQYTTKRGSKEGFLVSCSNGKQYQVGQYRAWKIQN